MKHSSGVSTIKHNYIRVLNAEFILMQRLWPNFLLKIIYLIVVLKFDHMIDNINKIGEILDTVIYHIYSDFFTYQSFTLLNTVEFLIQIVLKSKILGT